MRASCAIVAILWSFVTSTNALADFWTPCPRADPALNDCFAKACQHAIPFFSRGVPKYKLPPVDPLYENNLVIQSGFNSLGITVEVTNATVTGVKDATVPAAKVDLENNLLTMNFKIPLLKILSNYFFSGYILGIYVSTFGDDSMIFDNVDALIDVHYDVSRGLGQDGLEHEYMKNINYDVKLNMENANIEFNNLFYGNKFLESQANSFLSQNWRVLFDVLRPTLNKALSLLFDVALQGALQYFPLDEMFPYSDGS